MELWKSMAGMMEVELTSAEPEMALQAVNHHGIEIFYMRQVSELTCCFRIRRRDYQKLASLSQKRGETLRILRKMGIFWLGKRLLARPVFLVGIIFFLLVVMYLPTRVLFVRVEGNKTIPARRILASAEECGICFGASRREVRSEKAKNALLSAVPELQWAGVNTSGCVATVSVRERTIAEPAEEEKQVTSIVADRDGYILSSTVTKGNPLVQIGQTVKAGQILVSGYTNCGICIQATASEGEIIAQTNRSLDAVMVSECVRRGEIQSVKKKYSLIIRKKRINLWKDSGISDTSCGRMYEEYYITLPGGFRLPIALCVETCTSYENRTVEIPQEEAEGALREFAGNYLLQQMVAGEIRNRTETVSPEDGMYRLIGNYVCVEMIGRVRQEQIGDTNGKIG